ncbi:hypothetical protein CKAN_02691200 [Cinnamomum micranthum f. kanehirae]|uniref:Uncharacterized protein n=1 Tax=Cinnamomum micranthum f. kanehirae TaxID=337451 RepID=A0A443Q3A6_9MAGN|nr:hypothetical protein CKAN_02691200 [Cinnamomum micranthum f. kanehirae]
MVKQEQCRIRSQRHGRIRTTKKTKEKKPPQRGRGIPELERMILKEAQQKEIAAAALTPSIPFPLPLPASLPLWTPNFSPLTPISSVHLCGLHPVPMPPGPPYSQGGSSGGNWMDFFTKPSSMVNIPESPPYSSGVNPWMGLPSFQIIYSSRNLRVWPEDDGVVNQKRGHPSSLNDLPDGSSSIISFQPKFPSSSAPCHRREGPLSSSIVHAAANNLSFVKTIKENRSLDERICTLGRPAAASKSKPKQPKSVPSTHRGEVIPTKGSMEQSFLQWEALQQPQPFYNFFPMGPSSDPSSPTSDGRVEKAGRVIDLNLKL